MAETIEVKRAEYQNPPESVWGILRKIGPGLIISGSIVGSGELIVTTRLGAQAGFALLWLVLFSCFIKVFLQLEIGRFALTSGRTALEAFDSIPGPRLRLGRLRVNWLNILWAIMALCAVFQLAGILKALVDIFALERLGGLADVPPWVWFAAIIVLTSGLLVTGRYSLVENFTTTLVFGFTALTILTGLLLQTTEEFGISAGEFASGLTFRIPGDADGVWTAIGLLGITGVGATELIYYPYWCLEKGYARFAGPRDSTPQWRERAMGWLRVLKVDAWVSFVVYTVGTVAFYLLGAAVLNRQGVVPEDKAMHETLSSMYMSTFGGFLEGVNESWSSPGETVGVWVYVVGAFAVLFSTFFVATASNCRVFADAFHVFRIIRFRNEAERLKMVRILCVFVPMFCLGVVIAFGKPVTLVLTGAVAQASLLPFIAMAAVYLRYRKRDPDLHRRSAWTVAFDVCLWLAFLSMVVVGAYQMSQELPKLVEKLASLIAGES